MDSDDEFQLPGGEDFQDVTQILEEAALDMDIGTTLFTEGFTMQDAMSAIEIGEPRMDSGMILEQDTRPPFDPMAPMLPEEVCWILDTMLACEMEWHMGAALSQTVFSLLYVHHLQDIDPDIQFAFDDSNDGDPQRPIELITLVIRSAVFGLLKCCDLSWRELSRNRVHEGEDWQGEKCEVSLLEGYSVKSIIRKLDECRTWLLQTADIPDSSREDLMMRITFRKTLLELMSATFPGEAQKITNLLTLAQNLFRRIRSRPPPYPDPQSPAHLVFDMYVTRILHSFMPLRPLPLPPQERAWKALEGFLSDWQEICRVSNSISACSWQVFGDVRVWSLDPSHTVPYLRSLAQSLFFDGSRFLGRFPIPWMMDRFFCESLGIDYGDYKQLALERWTGDGPQSLGRLEHSLAKVMVPHIRSSWSNRPRHRRCLAKSVLDLHILYDMFQSHQNALVPVDESESRLFSAVPQVVLLWRLSGIREIVLSAFQLDLYIADEKPMAYWYASQVIEAHLDVLDVVMSVVPHETQAYNEHVFQQQFLTALQAMSIAMFLTLNSPLRFSVERTRLNFIRRYKWAFRPEYETVQQEPVAPPNFEKYLHASKLAREDSCHSPADELELARNILQGLVSSRRDGWAAWWHNDRIQFVASLSTICIQLLEAYKKKGHITPSDLIWDPSRCPWFPSVSLQTWT